MKKNLFCFLLILLFNSINSQQSFKNDGSFSFYENKGQIIEQNGNRNPDVKYLFASPGLNVQFRKDGFSYDIYEPDPASKKKEIISTEILKEPAADLLYHRIDFQFLNALHDSEIISEGKSSDYSNYYNIPGLESGVKEVYRYQRITYKNIYPNIDIVFFKPRDSAKTIEYNFIVKPGGRISDIKLKLDGASALLNENKLTMQVRFGEIQESIPDSWIKEPKGKKALSVTFKDLGNNIFGFNSDIDTADNTIIIDPVPTRIWGSYLGGSGEDYGKLKTDSMNNPYIVGTTASTNNIATTGAYQQTLTGNYDAFVMKLNKDGQRFWSTYYGLQFRDDFSAVDFDSSFNVYLVGNTHIPMPGYNSPFYVYRENVLMKLDQNGGFIYKKVFGGNAEDIARDIAFFNNSLYVVGNTFSDSGLATSGAFQTIKATPSGFTDGFLTRLESSTGNILWSTYVGGNASTDLMQIFSTTTGIEIMGVTRATNMVMLNPFQATLAGNTDGLYLNFSETGSLTKSSYIGSPVVDVIDHARRLNNTLIFSGYINSPFSGTSFKVNLGTNAIDHHIYNFVSNVQISSYSDQSGNIFFSGLASVNQTGIATPNAYMMTTGPFIKTYMIKYDQDYQKIWGTFYGGNGGTQLGRITKDNEDYIYFTGMSSNNTTGIATPGTFQQSGGHPSNDMFIAKFRDCTSYSNITSNSPVCPGSAIQFSATPGANYSWTGPNGFTSSVQNPVINNAGSVNAGVYYCTISGTGDCDGTFSVSVSVGDNIAPVPDVAVLPNITGNCQTVISNIPTATDLCMGLITATTADPLAYSVPGNYTIHWTYHDGNGNSTIQNQAVVITPETPPALNSPQTFCEGNQPKIQNIIISGSGIQWYDASGNILTPTTPLIHGVTYFASQTVNGCESPKSPVLIHLNSTPPPTGAATQTFCPAQNSTVGNLAVSGQNIIWYNAAGNTIPLTTPLINGQSYFSSQTLNGCISSQLLQVNVIITTESIPANDYIQTLCNPTTSTTYAINLSDYNADLVATPASYTFEYFTNSMQPINNFQNIALNNGTNTFYIKISNAAVCSKTVKLTIILNPKPLINMPQTAGFCEGQNVTLDAGSGFSAYAWSNGATTQSITAVQPGIYTVTVQNTFGCSNSASITVSQVNSGSITGVKIENQTATVIVEPPGNYSYSLDHFSWQYSNIFSNLNNGLYTVYVKTENGCIVGSYDFAIFRINNAITPNGDGINDKWTIVGLENYENSEVMVYDRYGFMVFKKAVREEFIWDGSTKSGPLPSGTYWYTIKVSDGRLFTGYLLIKNRE